MMNRLLKLKQEKNRIKTDIIKLKSFIGTTKYYTLSSMQQALLCEQELIMASLYRILVLRIDELEDDAN